MYRHALALTLLALASVSVLEPVYAQYVYADVVDYRPVYVQYYNTRTECRRVPGRYGPTHYTHNYHGTNALPGAVIGAGLGYLIGDSTGAAIGALGGALAGNTQHRHHSHVYSSPRMVEICEPVTDFHTRISYYEVDYVFEGIQYTTRMDYEPGPTVRIRLRHEVID